MGITLNETPLRTSRNFGINNIKVENIEFINNIRSFENIDIVKNNSVISNKVNTKPLRYGTGTVLEENIFKNANHKIKITTTSQKEDINIVYDFDEDNLVLVNQIEIEANGDANIIIQYKSSTKEKCVHNGIIRLKANETAKVNIAVINLLNNESDNFESFENEIYDNAEINYTIIDIGAKQSISNYYVNEIGENAKNTLKTVYLGTKEQVKDINYIAELRGKKAYIDIDVQGALQGNAKKNFKGTIDFKKGCKKAKGNENEYCMLLSNEASSIALPMLLCTEDDIEGNHSTASRKSR